MASIGMTRIKNQAIFLYEMDLSDLITKEEKIEDDNTELKIPNILEAQQEILDEEDSIYDINGIDFDEIHCSFAKSITQGLSSEIAQRLMAKKKNILVVKGKKEYYPRTLEVIEKIKSNNIFTQVLKVTCYNDMKYKPYVFFYELIAGLKRYSYTD